MNAQVQIMGVTHRFLFAIFAALVGLTTSTVDASLIVYDNGFDSVGFPNTGTGYTLDTGSGVLNFTEAAGANATRPTSVLLTDAALDTSDFIVSTRFTMNSKGGGTPTGNSSIGFGLFGTASTFPATAGSPNYLADWTILGATAGTLRILRRLIPPAFRQPISIPMALTPMGPPL